MTRIKPVSFSLLVNGVPQEKFYPSSGIRQGDPLSLYLFIICVVSLSSNLIVLFSKTYISSVPVSRGPIRISHLFFVDDNLVFCKANSMKWSRILFLLDKYEIASGEKLNKEKISIFLVKIPHLMSRKI